MKSLRCAAIILSVCVCVFGTQGQEQPTPPTPPTPPVTPATPPSSDGDRRAADRERAQAERDRQHAQAEQDRQRAEVERDKERAKADIERTKADMDHGRAEMERAMVAAKAQAGRGGGFVRIFGKTEPAAYLGVSTSPVDAALGEQLKLPKGVGLLVDYVEPKSPAEEAQIRQYDVLHKLDDQLLINAHQFAVLVRMHKAGEDVTLSIIRRGEERTIKVKLVEREVMALDANNPWGMPGVYGESGGGGGFGGGGFGGGGGGAFRPFKVAPPMPPKPGVPATQPGARVMPGFENMPYLRQMFTTIDPHDEVRLNDAQGTLILQRDGVGQRLIVATPEGKWISTYQINEPGQLKVLPPDVSARYERLLRAYRRVNERSDSDGTAEKAEKPRKPEKPEKPENPEKPEKPRVPTGTPTPGTN